MSEYTYNAENNSGLIKEGDYEATIERIERKVLPSGKEKLSVMYRIRTDVEQSYKNKCVFEDIWAEKENPKVFNRKRINQLLGTQKIEDGTEFDTINDVIQFLLYSNLILHITIEMDTYRGEDVNVVQFYKSSKVNPQQLEEKPKGGNLPVVDDDDLPF